MRTLRGRLALGALTVAASVALGACGGDGSDSAASSSAATQTTAAPEDTIAPDAAVGAGLVRLKGVAAKAAAAADGEAAKQAAEGLEPIWRPIEGTVKKNEPDLYLAVEDSFQRLESGDLVNAKKGAAALSTAVDAYLAKHPA
jgi:predicted component of type VI protein secretion system